jgi:diguanylate cyclase (GGDEF)-like protein
MTAPAAAAGMGSRIALRIFLLCAVCSLLPTLVIGVSVYTSIARAERAATQKRLEEMAKNYGLLLNERLNEAEGVLLDIGERALKGEPSAVYRSDGVRLAAITSQVVPLADLPATRSTHPERGIRVFDERLRNTRSPAGPVVALQLLVADDARALRLNAVVPASFLWDADMMLAAHTLLCVSLPGDAAGHCVGERAVATAPDRMQDAWSLYLTPHFRGGTWQVSVSQPRGVSEAGLSSVQRMFPWLALMAFVLALLLGSIETRRVHRPLAELLAAFRSMARGRFVRLALRGGQNEYSQLAKAFNHLSHTLRRQFRLLSALSQMDREILGRPAVDDLVATVLPRLPSMLDARVVAIGLMRGAAGLRLSARARDTGEECERRDCASLAAAGAVLREQWPELLWEELPIDVDACRRGALFVGTRRALRQQTALLRQAAGIAGRLAVALRNEDREALLVRHAYFDSLTDLPNRRLLCDRISQAVSNAEKGRHGLALLYVDLDRFKIVNDSLGHAAGDELLQVVAQRLARCVEGGDTVARLGGDELTVLLADADFEKAGRVAQRIAQELAAPVPLAGNLVRAQASIGIALYPADGKDAETLLGNADAAMYRGKKTGGGRTTYFEESMNQRSRRRLQVEHALRRALETDALRVAYQPKIRTADSAWYGVEALMRWDDPELGAVSPAEFIPIAEESGQIVALGKLALRDAARFAASCIMHGVPIGHVAVNVSVLQLRDEETVAYLEQLLHELRLPPALLQVEITESSLMEDVECTIRLLARIRDLGVRVAIDDFGTGYSSLAALQRLPVDILKIDRAFIVNITQDAAALELVRAMISVAHALGLQVVAEGVETAAQVALLREEGCEACQGFYFGSAANPEVVMRQAARWHSCPMSLQIDSERSRA